MSLDKKILCEEYCGLNAKFIRDLDIQSVNCRSCLEREVDEGLLFCGKCGRWYPIIEEIPHMLPDDLRNRDEDLSFLRKYSSMIPEDILKRGLPWSLPSK